MTHYLSHNRNYVLLFLVVLIIILVVLWALFRKCDDKDCKDSYSSDSYSKSKSKSGNHDQNPKSPELSGVSHYEYLTESRGTAEVSFLQKEPEQEPYRKSSQNPTASESCQPYE